MADAAQNFYARYTSLVPEADLVGAMRAQLDEVLALFRGVTDERAGVPDPPYTWTLREVVGHLVDGERIFGYRALRVARGDATPLPGYDEEPYVVAGEFDRRTLKDLLEEFEAVRRSHLLMFRHLPAAAWDRVGEVNAAWLSARDLAAVIVGHVRHHAAIVAKRLAG